MARQVPAGFRVGAFAALNNGAITGCVSDVKVKSKENSCGFAYDNNGKIRSSVAMSQPKAGENNAGFCHRNRGSISKGGWVRPLTDKEIKEKEAHEAKVAKALAEGKKPPKKKSGYSDENLRETAKLSEAEIMDKFGLSAEWKGADGICPDLQANYHDLGAADVIEIGTAEELLSVIADINSGDSVAAKASYRLTSDINLKGKTVDPIGIDEDTPFSGKFDGNGKTVKNFRVTGKGRQYCGFFGYVKGGEVANLAIDYVLSGKGGNTAGGMVGYNNNGSFTNCQVRVSITLGLVTGAFAGKNTGSLINCYVCGEMSRAFPILWVLVGMAAVVLIMAIIALIIALLRMNQPIYTPGEQIDVNQIPAPEGGPDVAPPPPGSNRISFEVLSEITISHTTKVGRMDYTNPKRATQDVVVSVAISDKVLTEKGYDLVKLGVRTAEEMAAEGYDPAKSYTKLYQSGRLQIGYQLQACKLGALPNGEHLPIGDYDMMILIDAYDPETHEKAVVNAQAPVTVHIVA